MAYEGWLIKIGTWQVPHKYIKPETYKVTPGKTKLYEWTDYDGGRHVVYNLQSQTKISFDTRESKRLSNVDVAMFHEALEAARCSNVAPGLNADVYRIQYYNPMTDAYEDKTFTMDDIDFVIERVTMEEPKLVIYNPITFSFTEAKDLDL